MADDLNDSTGVFIRQWPDKQTVHDAVDCGRGSKPDSQCHHRDERETRVSAEHPGSVSHGSPQISQPRHAVLVPQRFHRLRHPAGPYPRRPCRTLRRVGPAPRVLLSQSPMQPQLLFQILVIPIRPERFPESDDPLTKFGHEPAPVCQPSLFSSVCMMDTMRSHSAFSVAS